MWNGKSHRLIKKLGLLAAVAGMALPVSGKADVEFYGDENVLNTGTYASDPTAGATLSGLAPNVSTAATLITAHGYPFTPDVNDFPGTDQIYVGSDQTGAHDGYSVATQRIAGPDDLALDYSAQVPAGDPVQSLTLGIAFDDFQNALIGDPFTLTINGQPDAALSALANSLDQSGPVVQFYTMGVDPALLNSNNVLNLSIDEGGDGGDGYAVDFLTVGVTVPEPASVGVVSFGAALMLRRRRMAK